MSEPGGAKAAAFQIDTTPNELLRPARRSRWRSIGIQKADLAEACLALAKDSARNCFLNREFY